MVRGKNKMKTIQIKELNIEVETELHTEMDRIREIPKGWRLLTFNEWIFIYNKYQDKINYGDFPDEIVEQPIEKNKEKYPYWNVWFRNLGGRSVLDGYGRLLLCSYGVRGVRFCRDLKARQTK